MNIIVLSVLLVGFFHNPFHWRHKHPTVSVDPRGVYIVEQPPFSDARCFGDDTAVFILEPDDSIGIGASCSDAMANGRKLNPAIRWQSSTIPPYKQI